MLLTESLLGTSSASAPVYVEDVFSTYLYTGTGAERLIPNSIQLGDGATASGWMSTLALAASNSSANSVTFDSSGNFYVCGISDSNMLLAKYNSSGVIQWQRSLGSGANPESGTSIAVDSSGNVYIGGSETSANLGYVAKYDSAGTLQWQRQLTGVSIGPNNLRIALDSSANVYFCTTGIGGANTVMLVVKYNSSGTLQFQKQLSRSGFDIGGQDIKVDSSGNVYVCGSNGGVGSTALQVAKLTSAGATTWERTLNTSSFNQAFSISLDSSNNVYIGGSVSSSGGSVIAKYDTNGTIQWQRLLTSGGTNGLVAADSSGNVYVLSYNTATFITKYNTSGTVQWQRRLDSNKTVRQIVADNSNNIYICGSVSISGYDAFFVAKLPADGSGTGGCTVGTTTFTYYSTTLTSSTPTYTDAASSLTNGTSSRTASTPTLTSSTSTLTSNTTALVEGTGKGGLVWLKGRSGATDHALYDTARGATFDLVSNSTAAQTTQSTGLTSFAGSGFSIGALAKINTNAATYASWTFRKQAKFFDIVTYTGNGVSGRQISHNLQVSSSSQVGCVMVKRTDTSSNWMVFSRGMNNSMFLNSTNADVGSNTADGYAVPQAATTFSVYDGSSSINAVNANGGTYVAYLFAHNAGGFGAAGTDNVISCGSFTGTSKVTLGYEPQFVLMKQSNAASSWYLYDTMRGIFADASNNNDPYLTANNAFAEATGQNYIGIDATGFTPSSAAVGPSDTWIYIAIRRGPMKTPTSGTSVFSPQIWTGNGTNRTITSGGIPPDLFICARRTTPFTGTSSWWNKLAGQAKYFVSQQTGAEQTTGDSLNTASNAFLQDGIALGANATQSNTNYATSSTYVGWFMRRAPGFFDVVCYTGTGSALTVNHNLGVTPEFWITKKRSAAQDWFCGGSVLGNATTDWVYLNTTNAKQSSANIWLSPTATTFGPGSGLPGELSASGATYVAYLFATVAGVSKVGSYTGTGTTQQINCGFTGGARFVLIKRTDSTGDWYVWDSARGIVAGNDPYLLLNDTAAEVTSTDYIDTYSAGFEISSTAPAAINANGGSFIFLAIA